MSDFFPNQIIRFFLTLIIGFIWNVTFTLFGRGKMYGCDPGVPRGHW